VYQYILFDTLPGIPPGVMKEFEDFVFGFEVRQKYHKHFVLETMKMLAKQLYSKYFVCLLVEQGSSHWWPGCRHWPIHCSRFGFLRTEHKVRPRFGMCVVCMGVCSVLCEWLCV